MDLEFEILQYFLYKRVIKRQEFNKCLEEIKRQNVLCEQYLVTNGYCNQVKACEVLGEFFCLPQTELDMLDVDINLSFNLSYDYIRTKKILPVSINADNVMLIAIARPLDYNSLSTISTFYVGKYDFVLVPSFQIERYVDTLEANIATTKALNVLEEKDLEDQDLLEETIILSHGEDDNIINTPSVKLLDSIIKEAITLQASDIHIEPRSNDVRVRFRIDGDLSEKIKFSLEHFPAISARLKVISGMNIAERRIPQDGRINMTVSSVEYDFRVSTLPGVYGEKFVIRILDKNAFAFTRQELGFTPHESKIIDKVISKPHGIVLLTGPTGCGKSTTLYSFLKELNKPDVNIITVEDPIEYTLDGINQTQVNVKADYTFASALRSFLRQDPDIIMLGEIRDEETAEIAVRAAITGHLVFSTLHTNDSVGAINRLIDMGVSNYLIADALVSVISQRLVKKLCPICRKKLRTNAREMSMLGLTEPISIYKPQGCQYCNETGYKGRIAVHEVLYIDNRFRNHITKDLTIEELRRLAKEYGMITLFDGCKDYVLNGLTSISELMSLNIE